MHNDWIENLKVLDKFGRLGYVVTEIALMILCGALGLLAYTKWIVPPVGSSAAQFTPYEFRLALLFSASYMVLSGYFITLLIAHFLFRREHSWMLRSVSSSLLFILHALIFGLLIGESFAWGGLDLVVLGLVCVWCAVAINQIVRRFATLWGEHRGV